MVDILLFSGGVDSLIGYFWLHRPKILYFKMGHKYEKKELNCIENLCKLIPNLKENLTIIDDIKLGKYENGKNAYIRFRNILMAEVASNYGERIIICGVKGDNISDKSLKAYKKMNNCLNEISKKDDKHIQIFSPFWTYTKTNLIKWGLENIPNFIELLKNSVSCYDEHTLGQCGKCNSCLRKAIALEANNIDFEGWFENDIKKYSEIQNYIDRMKNKEYDDERTKESLEVFRKWGWEC